MKQARFNSGCPIWDWAGLSSTISRLSSLCPFPSSGDHSENHGKSLSSRQDQCPPETQGCRRTPSATNQTHGAFRGAFCVRPRGRPMQYGLRFCPSLRRLGGTCQVCSPALPCARRWVIEWALPPRSRPKGATAMCRGGQQEQRTGHRPRPKSMSGRFARRFHGVPARSAHTGQLGGKRRGGAAIRGVVRSFPVRAHFAAPPVP